MAGGGGELRTIDELRKAVHEIVSLYPTELALHLVKLLNSDKEVKDAVAGKNDAAIEILLLLLQKHPTKASDYVPYVVDTYFWGLTRPDATPIDRPA